MGTKYTAKYKLTWLWNKLEEQGIFGLGYSENKLIAEFIIAHGTTRRTALELIKTFEDAEKIIRRDGKIYARSCFNDDLTIKEENFKQEMTDEENAILNS